jgi:hypothetical protein
MYKVFRLSNFHGTSNSTELEELLNDGWVISRADRDGRTDYIIYILYRTPRPD